MTKRYKKGLEGKAKDAIIPINSLYDKQGTYIPYCDFNCHPGIIHTYYAHTCMRRNCNHYKRLYIQKKNKEDNLVE